MTRGQPAEKAERFRMTGTLLSEAYSSPPGAFNVRGELTVTHGSLTLTRRRWLRASSPLTIPLASITRSELVPYRLYVEWDRGDGAISGIHLKLESNADWARLKRSLEGCLPGGAAY